MAIDLFKGFTNPMAGESFRCISSTPEAFVFEWIVQPNGQVPNEHIHYNQAEIFHVKSGEIEFILDGKKQSGKNNISIVVPKGSAHIAHNHGKQPLTCIVEFQPAYESYQFFQCMGGLISDKDYDKTGQVNIPKMCYFMKKMNARCLTRPTKIPAPVFKLVMNLFYLVGVMKGWNKLYIKYTGSV